MCENYFSAIIDITIFEVLFKRRITLILKFTEAETLVTPTVNGKKQNWNAQLLVMNPLEIC
jgi:hypothetical protein